MLNQSCPHHRNARYCQLCLTEREGTVLTETALHLKLQELLSEVGTDLGAFARVLGTLRDIADERSAVADLAPDHAARWADVAANLQVALTDIARAL